MSVLATFILGLAGGAVAFYLQLPLPWLLGSLIAMVLFRRLPIIKMPPQIIARSMRILLGVALGGAVANSIPNVPPSLLTISLSATLIFVGLVTAFGIYYFRRLPNFSVLDSFMSALPGGLTFLVSMAGNLGDRFPKIALIHTVRMVALILTFSVFAYFIGPVDSAEIMTYQVAFSFPLDPQLWQVLVITLLSGFVAVKVKVAGGDIMFPLMIAAAFYGFGWVEIPMPELITTLAMVTFGIVIGCKIASGPVGEYGDQVKASLVFTAAAITMALVIALGLGEFFNMNYFLFFLALAPGSIPEMCLIAMALGFDVGFVALAHTCRYLFIMLVGALGFNIISTHENKTLSPNNPV